MKTVDEVVTAYQGYRATQSIADAANATIAQLAILPSELVDAFKAAQLNLNRSNEDAAVIQKQRNELLVHFSDPKKAAEN